MFKNKEKFKGFFKRQLALVLAIVMAFSSLGSAGMALSKVHAADTYVNDHGQAFVDKLIEITAHGTPYVWGGWQYAPNASWHPQSGHGSACKVDCRGFVRVALRDVYDLSIYNTWGYLVNENDEPVDKNGNVVSYDKRVLIDVAAYDAESTLRNHVGKRICVEGNGKRTYYRVACAGTVREINNNQQRWSGLPGGAMDISANGTYYSSVIAYACQFPGSIISHNGHYGVGIGEFHSRQAILDAYPGLTDANGNELPNSGSNPSAGIIRWSQANYDQGNAYDISDARYWFGKTVFLSACSEASGIRADNYTTVGKKSDLGPSSELTILLCESVVEKSTITFEKVDQASGKKVPGAVYGIYSDPECKNLVKSKDFNGTFTTSTGKVEITINRGRYYVKEISAPAGYELSTKVTEVDCREVESIKVQLTDAATHATVLVRKVDTYDASVSLGGSVFVIQEYDVSTERWYDLVTLSYIEQTQAFTINSSYTNHEGTKYSDNALHYTPSNGGYFKLVEKSAQEGYINSGYTKTFNVKDGNLILTGANAVKNTAKLSLLINKVNVNNEPLAGVKFRFEYNGRIWGVNRNLVAADGTYTDEKGRVWQVMANDLITDENGEILITGIEEGDLPYGTLYEIKPIPGYFPLDNFIYGQPIGFTKNADTLADDGTFRYEITVVNGTDVEPIKEVSKGTLIIQKTDMSRVDSFNVGVPDTVYSIFSRPELGDENIVVHNGQKLENLVTDGNGQIVIKDLPIGTYYIREMAAPYGYAIQTKTFVAVLSGDAANENGELIVKPEGIGDFRQHAEIKMQKLDETTGKPVAGAVYALYAESDLTTATYGEKIDAGTKLGYYVTDANGMITVNQFGTPEFTLGGKTFEAITPAREGGDASNGNGGSGLVNGKYYFVEIYAPDGYLINDTRVSVNARWVPNNDDVDVDFGAGVVTAAGKLVSMDPVITKDKRQTVEIVFNKLDSVSKNTDANYHYNLSSDCYDVAVNKNLAATLQGAVYMLINEEDIVDVTTGTIIPAQTILGHYTTNSNASFKIQTMNNGAYNGHPLPNGRYSLVELSAPQGYTISDERVQVTAKWTSTDQSPTITKFASAEDEILKQSLTINKVDEKGNGLKNVIFYVYSVSTILEKCGYDSIDSLPWDTTSATVNGFHAIDRTKFEQLIRDYDLKPAKDSNYISLFSTDDDGIVTTGDFIYGDYIVYEVECPYGYYPANATYVQIPWVLEDSGGFGDDEQAQTQINSYTHKTDVQPATSYLLTVVNEKIPEKTTFTVGKVWADNDNQYGLRPDSIKVQLFANGEKYGDEITLTAESNWSYTWNDLPKHDSDDVEIVYTVDEIGTIEHYTKSVQANVITNTCTYIPPETIDYTVNKVWADNNNEYGVRPDSVQVQLYANGKASGAPVTLTERGNWSYTWTDLLKYDENDELIEYTIDEISTFVRYSKSVNGNIITNTYIPPELTTFDVLKVWDDNNNEHGFRPDSVVVQLYANGEPVGNPVTLTEAMNWQFTWTDLLKFEADDVTPMIYTVDELDVPANYAKTVAGSTITNTCTYIPPETIDYTVNKVWVDDDNAYGVRPDSIQVQLYVNGEASGAAVTLTAEGGWTYTWEDLLKYDTNDELINYTVDEISTFVRYTKSVDGNVITNTYKAPETMNYTVNKVWDDNNNEFGFRPNSINLQLFADGQPYGQVISITSAQDWQFTWAGLLKYHEDDVTPIVYTVDEVIVPENYEKTVNDNVITNKNTYTPPETIDYVVNKVWVDDDNAYGVRPNSVQVQLYANGEAFGSAIELTPENNWSYSWTELLKYDENSELIEYTVDELSTFIRYTKSIDGNVITNTYKAPETISYTATKVWVDNNNEFGFRPNSVNIQLYADGQPYGAVVSLTEAQNWTFTWEGLLKYHEDDETPIVYTIDEVITPEKYEKSVDGNTITNTCVYVPITVIVSKYEIINNERNAVPGAVLQILDQSGNVVELEDGTKCEWTTVADSEHKDEFGVSGHLIDQLLPGTYILHEHKAPDGYATAKDVEFEVKSTADKQYVYMEEKPLVVQVSKLDSTSNTHIVGAELTIVDANKIPVVGADGHPIKWTSDGNVHTITGLKVGKYYVQETKTPIGYQKSDDVAFDVVDSEAAVVVRMYDGRTVGSVELTKVDADTKLPIKNAVFNLISTEEVKDPISGEVIYTKDQVVTTLTTDANGYAKIDANLPIGTYNADGFLDYINYKLVEISAPGAQYDVNKVQCDVKFEYQDDVTPVIKRVFNLENTKPNVIVNKTGKPLTFVGAYDDKHDVTVVTNGETIEYTITVQNTGAATAYGIVVRDMIPMYTNFVNNDTFTGAYDSERNMVYWTIDSLQAGASIDLKFNVQVNTAIAQEIVNIAQYTMPVEIPEPGTGNLDPKNDDNNWKNTEAVVHQVVTFTKDSVVKGGTDKDTATAVKPGEKITYKMTFTATNIVKGVVVTDKVPEGLTYVSGSAKVNGIVDEAATFNPDNRVLTFGEKTTNIGDTIFEFDVIVDDIEIGTTADFENKAQVHFVKNTNTNEKSDIDSNVVTHKTDKMLEVHKYGEPTNDEKVIAGDYSNVSILTKDQDVTVLQKDEFVLYQIVVKNNGTSAIEHVVISDAIPDGMRYKSHQDVDGVKSWYDESADALTWYIDELAAGETVVLNFTASVVEQKAQLLINVAHYGIVKPNGDEAPVLGDDKHKTEIVKDQVIEFHKTSEVLGGKDKTDATVVAVGDVITYTLELINKDRITNVTIFDELPEGLEFIPGSIKIKNANESEWTAIDDEIALGGKNPADAAAICFTDMDLDAGTYYFRFDVKVKHIPVNTEKFFINQATVEYDRKPDDNAEEPRRDVLLSETISHMTSTKIEGDKTADIPTYVGNYENKEFVTVVLDCEEIVYTITVNNVGKSDLHNVIIKDPLPKFTQFVKAENGGTFDEENGIVYWTIDTIKAGETAKVQFTVRVDSKGTAQEIVNKAAYSVPENKDNVLDDEWIWTDNVIYQTIAVEKDASIDHGVDTTDAKNVPIGTKFAYTIKVTTTNDVYGLIVTDKIPDGLSFVADSASYKLPNGDVIKVNDLAVGEDGMLTFPTIDKLPIGDTVFTFDVKVEDVKEYDKDYFFVNSAAVVSKANKDSEKAITLITNTVSHKTIKTNETETPTLGFEGSGEVVMWATISIISTIAMFAFGIYALADNKKRKNNR